MTQIIDVLLDRLHDHPLNAHIVTDRDREKLTNNIRRSRRYPALIVRELTENSEYWPGEPGHYQILDGHQRRHIFEDLVEEGLTEFEVVRCDDWSPITDEEAALLLATLNTWGDNQPRKRAELLHHITKFTSLQDAAQILPETERQMKDAAKLLQQPIADIQRLVREAEAPDVIEMSFVVGGDQKAALARFTAAAQLFAVFYGAELTNVAIEEGGERGRTAVLTFRIQNSARARVEEALKKAGAALPPGTKNKRGRALEELAAGYLAAQIEEESQVPIGNIEKQRTAQAPEPKPRKSSKAS